MKQKELVLRQKQQLADSDVTMKKQQEKFETAIKNLRSAEDEISTLRRTSREAIDSARIYEGQLNNLKIELDEKNKKMETLETETTKIRRRMVDDMVMMQDEQRDRAAAKN